LDQQLGLLHHRENYSFNCRGLSEKYMMGDNDLHYYILPNGEFYRWGGSIADSTLLATLDPSYHADPSLLHDAVPAQSVLVTLSIDQQAGTLTIDPVDGYTGQFEVRVTASDGSLSAEQSFNVEVTNAAAALGTSVDSTVYDPDGGNADFSGTYGTQPRPTDGRVWTAALQTLDKGLSASVSEEIEHLLIALPPGPPVVALEAAELPTGSTARADTRALQPSDARPFASHRLSEASADEVFCRLRTEQPLPLGIDLAMVDDLAGQWAVGGLWFRV